MSSWGQTLTVIVTLAAFFVAGFGFLWQALTHRLDRLEDLVRSADQRLARIEGRLRVPGDE